MEQQPFERLNFGLIVASAGQKQVFKATKFSQATVPTYLIVFLIRRDSFKMALMVRKR